MKKVLFFFLALCLVFSLSVPVLAESENPVYVLSGKWTFNPQISYPSYLPECLAGQTLLVADVNFIARGVQNTNFIITCDDNYGTSLVFSSKLRYFYDLAQWKDDTSRYIDFGDTPQIVTSDFYHWFTDNAVRTVCNSSTCTFSDLNSDFICDICGCPCDFSNRTYNYVETVTFRKASGGFAKAEYRSSTPVNIRGYIDGSAYRVDAESSVWVVVYSSDDNYAWTETASGDFLTHYPSFDLDDEVIASTFNWYSSSSGDIFFPLPLWTTVSNSAQRGLQVEQQAVVGVMITLALCGVGCLTLLAVLKLFGKRSLIYRR